MGAANDDIGTITAIGACRDDQSLQVANVPDDQARYACLRSKGVQQTCGMDGRTARLNAFREWMANLDRYQKQCEQQRGTFSYAAADFNEPADETFCTVPRVSVSYGAFENPICQFESGCPAVQVTCSKTENDLPAFHIPQQAMLLPGVPVAIQIH